MMQIEFILNGQKVSLDTDPLRRLLDVLRTDFGLTGVKEGCGEGECGACSVLLGDKLAPSCLVPVGTIAGEEITTIDGFRTTERYRIINKSFSDAGSVQCGFCTPGFIMAAEALFRITLEPSEEQIREAISGNLCRCTGYNMIVDGIRDAARMIKEHDAV